MVEIIPPSIKPWILPNFTALVNHEKIDMEFNANVTQITEDTVTCEVNGEVKQYTMITYLR